jgi:hypothetical protein
VKARIGVVAVTLAALAGILSVAAPAQAASRVVSAQDAPLGIQASCYTGSDTSTSSWVYCGGSGYSFRAVVTCFNFTASIGTTNYGTWKVAGLGQYSYAYCPSGSLRQAYSYELYV